LALVSYGRRRFWHATLRLRIAIRRHRPPQTAVLSKICCFGERKVVMSKIRRRGGRQASVFSSMRIITPKQGKSARLDYSSEFGLLRHHLSGQIGTVRCQAAGPGTKLLGSGILNVGSCAAWDHAKLSAVGRDDPS